MVSYVRPPVMRGTEASNEELVQSRSTGALTEDPMMSWRVRWPRWQGWAERKAGDATAWKNMAIFGIYLKFLGVSPIFVEERFDDIDVLKGLWGQTFWFWATVEWWCATTNYKVPLRTTKYCKVPIGTTKYCKPRQNFPYQMGVLEHTITRHFIMHSFCCFASRVGTDHFVPLCSCNHSVPTAVYVEVGPTKI